MAGTPVPLGDFFPNLCIHFFRHISGEVNKIRSMAPINLIVHSPKTAEGQKELARRAADVHAAAVTQRIHSLDCPTSQKLELLDAVIEAVKERSREQI